MKGFVLKKLVSYKAVQLTLIVILLAVPAIFLTGCSAGQVVAPFNPKDVKPEPYTPEPEWSERTDTTLTTIESMKKQAGQTVAPGSPGSPGTTGAAGTASTPGGTTPTPVPGPPPGPAPAPTGRTPLTTDGVYGIVRDRIEGGVIPRATITLRDRREMVLATFETNAAGEYSFVLTDLPYGYYKVSAAAAGYNSIPLSTAEFYYIGISVTANLELAYQMPYQVINGGGYVSYGLLSRMVPSAPGAQTVDVASVPFYSATTQVTYPSVALFDEGLGNDVGARQQAFVEYYFRLPAPKPNRYVYDHLEVTFGDIFKVTSNTWASGGVGDVYWWNPYPQLGGNAWERRPSSGLMQPTWYVVNQDTGDTIIRVAANDSNPWVLTSIKLSYDYHKDISTPNIAQFYSRPADIDKVNLTWFQSEDCYVTLRFRLPDGTITGPFLNKVPLGSDLSQSLDCTIGIASGAYSAIFDLEDQAGNINTRTYPFTR